MFTKTTWSNYLVFNEYICNIINLYAILTPTAIQKNIPLPKNCLKSQELSQAPRILRKESTPTCINILI